MSVKFQAAEGQIWVCRACGRTNKNKWGTGRGSWDESCALNAVLCIESSLEFRPDGRVRKADPVEKGEVKS